MELATLSSTLGACLHWDGCMLSDAEGAVLGPPSCECSGGAGPGCEECIPRKGSDRACVLRGVSEGAAATTHRSQPERVGAGGRCQGRGGRGR